MIILYVILYFLFVDYSNEDRNIHFFGDCIFYIQ
jgi:hypothetical protein